jgi:transcriptional regulator with XRE-family HTH domain
MVQRIKELILNEGLTSGTFADLIGVQRSSISHILNGRNNPSLDFIVKTLQQFPKVNPEWLLMGQGEMYRNEQSAVKQSFKEPSIFDTVPEAPKPKTIIKEEKLPEKEIITIEKTEKFVNKVLIFYSDSTYTELIPQNLKE